MIMTDSNLLSMMRSLAAPVGSNGAFRRVLPEHHTGNIFTPLAAQVGRDASISKLPKIIFRLGKNNFKRH